MLRSKNNSFHTHSLYKFWYKSTLETNLKRPQTVLKNAHMMPQISTILKKYTCCLAINLAHVCQFCFDVVLCLAIWFGAWWLTAARNKHKHKKKKARALQLLNFTIKHLHSHAKRKGLHVKVIYYSAAKGHFVTSRKTFLKLLLPGLCAHCKNLPVPRVTVLRLTFCAGTVQILHTKQERQRAFQNKQKNHIKKVLQFFTSVWMKAWSIARVPQKTTISLQNTKHTLRIWTSLLAVHLKATMN